MALTHATATRNALADATVDLIDGGTGAGKVKIYTTGQGALLAEITLADPAFGAAVAGVATANSLPVEDTSANATGTAAEFAVTDSDDVEIFTGTVTATGGGGDMEMVSTTITATETVKITAFTYTAPA